MNELAQRTDASWLTALYIPATSTAVWSADNSRAARLEGWDLNDSAGSANGDWQVQCLDDPVQAAAELGSHVPTLKFDDRAWRLVYEGNQPHHIAARAFLETHSPKELASINKVGDALYPRHCTR